MGSAKILSGSRPFTPRASSLIRNLLLAVSSFPVLNASNAIELDVTDTLHCQHEGFPYFRFRSTFNDEAEILPLLPPPFNVPTHHKKGVARYYDIVVDDNGLPLFAHLGRGSSLSGRHPKWLDFLEACGCS